MEHYHPNWKTSTHVESPWEEMKHSLLYDFVQFTAIVEVSVIQCLFMTSWVKLEFGGRG